MSRRTTKKWAGLTARELEDRWGRESVYPYGSIDSTNDAARELAAQGVPHGTIVVCREQSAGRGRGDRSWHSPADAGLYLSMIFRPEAAELPPVVSVLAGLGVVEELDRAFAGLHPTLKWPNDLIAEDRKLGGLLCEASWTGIGPGHLIVGVGINVKSMAKTLPRKLHKRTTWLDAHHEGAELPEVADAVIRGLEDRLGRLDLGMDSPTLDSLDRYDWLKNRRVRLLPADSDEGVPGVCVGIAPDGALLFRPDRGALRRVKSGRVEAETT
jgi:BirA family biotin operon repressor/biotin-[acetyl-CoA-carboxylase] ligase